MVNGSSGGNGGSPRGGSGKRRVNPALLLGGNDKGVGSDSEGELADDFTAGKRVDRGLSTWSGNDASSRSNGKPGSGSGVSEPVVPPKAGGFTPGAGGNRPLLGGKPSNPLTRPGETRKPVLGDPVEEVKNGAGESGFVSTGDSSSKSNTPVSGRAADVLKNLQAHMTSTPGSGSAVSEPVKNVSSPERTVEPGVKEMAVSKGNVDDDVSSKGSLSQVSKPSSSSKPAPGRGFMLPGEKRPVRAKPVNSVPVMDAGDDIVVDPATGEVLDDTTQGSNKNTDNGLTARRRPETATPNTETGKTVQGADEAVVTSQGGVRGGQPARTRNVNPLFQAGEKEADARPVKRPGFLLDTDKIPAKRPVDFGKNKTLIEDVAPTVEKDVKSVPVKKVNKKKSSYVTKPSAAVESGDWLDEDEGTSAGLGGEVDDRYVKPQYEKGFHLTERDVIMMRFMARYRYAYLDQLARLVDSIPRNVGNRLRTLEKRGFVRKESITDRQHLWTIRKAGLVLVDSDFREIKKGSISYATIAHTIGLVSLGVELEREAGGKNLLGEPYEGDEWVYPERRWKMGLYGNPEGLTRGEMTVTEREIRQGQMRWRGNRSYTELRGLVDSAVENPEGPELEEGMEGLFVVYGPGGKGGEHVPDLVVARERDENGNPQHIAVELELTPKTPTEWRKILRNYRDNGLMYSKVYYFTHKKSIGTTLLKLAADEGFAEKFVVRKYVPKNKIPFWG